MSRLPETNLVGQHDINSRLFTDRCVTIVWKLELENKAEGVASLHGRTDFEKISREMVTKMVSVCGGGEEEECKKAIVRTFIREYVVFRVSC